MTQGYPTKKGKMGKVLEAETKTLSSTCPAEDARGWHGRTSNGCNHTWWNRNVGGHIFTLADKPVLCIRVSGGC